MQGTCVVSDSPFPQAASASAPGPLRLEEVPAQESCSAPVPQPVGRKVYIPKTREMLLKMLSESAQTGRVPSSYEILTWMDSEHDNVDGFYLDSYSDFETFGVNDALDIMENEVCHLATFGHLGQDGATRLRQYTRDQILVPLGLWETESDSISSLEKTLDIQRVFKWRNGVEDSYIEEIEDTSDVKVEDVEDVEEVSGGDSTDIEEIDGWRWQDVNYGQWEEEI